MKVAVVIALLLLTVIAASSIWTLATVRQQSCMLNSLRLSGELGAGTPGRIKLPGQNGPSTHITISTYVGHCDRWPF